MNAASLAPVTSTVTKCSASVVTSNVTRSSGLARFPLTPLVWEEKDSGMEVVGDYKRLDILCIDVTLGGRTAAGPAVFDDLRV